jgi:uncharacterized protein YfiM (DUF2279 family)
MCTTSVRIVSLCQRAEIYDGRMAGMQSTSFPTALRWVPALFMMVIIFLISSLPAYRIPYFGEYDVLIKKFAHALGYAMLGLAYFYALPRRISVTHKVILAFMMAILFALSDEFHQSFVEGRTSSLNDVVIDGCGTILALIIGAGYSSNSNSKSTS